MAEVESSMKGKVCLVTGATSGIGCATAEALAARGATVVLVGRDAEKTARTAARIRETTGNSAVEYLLADLSSQAEVRRLARDFQGRHDRLHVLINNAGAAFTTRTESVDGIELTLALNHLAYFLLTNLLLDTIKASAPARIVNVASGAHTIVKALDFDDLQASRKKYGSFRVYGHSKLANILFTRELARRLEGTGVTANALHPGLVATNFGAKMPAVARFFFRLFGLPPEKGARTVIYLATSPGVEGVSGRYFYKEKEAKPSAGALDAEAARRLWQISETMTGLAPAAAAS
ncbi:MAG TPA: SDR family oxidoreductase [Isosphaeraceae bacterium]|jgi:NAD(P)-dependent dehydrogenase (short-subunit alcohol dehydrogenase family)|nr:SDR family oxidoreductase [Isosphaeraceae bacterium]